MALCGCVFDREVAAFGIAVSTSPRNRMRPWRDIDRDRHHHPRRIAAGFNRADAAAARWYTCV